METLLSVLGLIIGVVGVITSGFKRTDRLLKEIRDVLREIRDGLDRTADLKRHADYQNEKRMEAEGQLKIKDNSQ